MREIRSPSDGLLLPPLHILSARRVKAEADASVSRGQRCDGWLRGGGAGEEGPPGEGGGLGRWGGPGTGYALGVSGVIG